MKFFLNLLLAVLLITFFIPEIAYAFQIPPPAPPMLPQAPGQAPIDGGLGLLAAAGGAYAIKKLRDKNKE